MWSRGTFAEQNLGLFRTNKFYSNILCKLVVIFENANENNCFPLWNFKKLKLNYVTTHNNSFISLINNVYQYFMKQVTKIDL